MAIAIVLAIGSVAGPVRAQDPAKLAMEAYEHYQAERWTQCVDVATRAYELFPAPTLLVMKARAQVKLGKLVDALATYDRASSWKAGAKDPPAFERAVLDARTEKGALEKKIPTLRVVVRSASADRTKVSIDGRDVERPGDALRLDPGEHRVEISDEDNPSRRAVQSVTLREGEESSLEIALPSAGRSAPPPPESEPTYLPAALLFGGAGAMLTVGGILGGLALSKSSELADLCAGRDPCPRQHEDLGNEVTTFATVSTVSFAVGGALAAVGLVLAIVPPRSEPVQRTDVAIIPALGPTGAFLSVVVTR